MNDPTYRRSDVAIIGAGPTGLTAAVRLAQTGIDHVVLDAADAPTTMSKAALIHASTLEMFDKLGLAEAAVAAGRVMPRIQMVDRGRRLLTIDLSALPTDFPFALGLPQSKTEALLLAELARSGGKVSRGHVVESVVGVGPGHLLRGTCTRDEVREPFEIAARYVVAADGSRSAVRDALGVEFGGETYPMSFVLADVPLETTAGHDEEASINLSADGVTVLGRLPSRNHRIVATVPDGVEVPPRPDRAFVDALLTHRRVSAVCAAEPVWSSRFRIHRRVAERFRVDDVFLAGDAAHIPSPAAGQGMNTGIGDGYDIATRLAAVLSGISSVDLLDGYEPSRREVALEVLRFTDRLTRLAMMRNPLLRGVRRLGVMPSQVVQPGDG